MNQGTDSRALRLLNAQRIVDVVVEVAPGALTRPQIGRLAGLSKPTVSALVADMVETGLLVLAESPDVSVSVGRPALQYRLDPLIRPVVGAEVGPAMSRVAVADLMGGIVSEIEFSTPGDAVAAIGAVCAAARSLIADFGDRCRVVCLGVPGIYCSERDEVDNAVYLDGFDGLRVADRVQDVLGLPSVLVENDVNLAAVGEVAAANDHGASVRDFAVIMIGSGIGLGLVLDGDLYRGGSGAAGELGSMVIASEGSGRRALTVEGVASGPSICRRFSRAPERSRASDLPADCVVADVLAAAATGDEAATVAVDEAAAAVGRAISHLHFIIDPARIVLGGSVGTDPYFLSAVRRHLSAMPNEFPPVEASPRGVRAALLGAVEVAAANQRSQLVGDLFGGLQR